jgi:hypothetical protein
LNTLDGLVDGIGTRVTNLEGNFPLPLENLSNTMIVTPVNGEFLKFDGGANAWINDIVPAGVD